MPEPSGSMSRRFETAISSGGALWPTSPHFVVSLSRHLLTPPNTKRSRHVDLRSRAVSVAEPDAEHFAHCDGGGVHHFRHDEAIQRSADASGSAATRAPEIGRASCRERW